MKTSYQLPRYVLFFFFLAIPFLNLAQTSSSVYFQVGVFTDYKGGRCGGQNGAAVVNYPVMVSFGDSFTYILYTDSTGIAADTLLTPTVAQSNSFSSYPETIVILDSAGYGDDNAITYRTGGSSPYPTNRVISVYRGTVVRAPYKNLNRCANFSVVAQPIENQPLRYQFNTDFPKLSQNLNWQFGDGNTSQEMFPEHTYASPGVYQVCLTIDGCTSCDSITVSSQNVNSCNYTLGYTLFNHNWVRYHTDQPGIDQNIIWTFNGTDSINQHRPFKYYGTDTIIYCATLTGCNSVCDTFIPPLSCRAEYDVTHKSKKQAELEVLNYRPGPEYIFSYTGRSTGLTVVDTITQQTNAGTYIVQFPVYDEFDTRLKVVDSNLGCSDSICKTVDIVKAECLAHFSVNYQASSNNNLVIVNNSQFRDSSNVSYRWAFGDGDSAITAFPSHTYQQFGAYKLCLYVTSWVNGQSCFDSYCDTIGIDSLGNFYKNQQGGFTINVISPQSIGVEEYEEPIGVYPNPAEDVLFIEAPEFYSKLSLYDLNGKNVMSINELTNKIALPKLSPGLYLLILEKEGRQLKPVKLIVK